MTDHAAIDAEARRLVAYVLAADRADAVEVVREALVAALLRGGQVEIPEGSAMTPEDARIAELRAEVERLTRELEEALKWGEPGLVRDQPCGCRICQCASTERCGGCGARLCAKHRGAALHEDPSAVWAPHPLVVRATAAESRVAKLEKVLRPFATAYDDFRAAPVTDKRHPRCDPAVCSFEPWRDASNALLTADPPSDETSNGQGGDAP